MRNYTDFSDQAILACIKENGGNPSKCTSIVQLSFKENGTIEKCLSIWQDISQGWDNDVRLLYSVPVEQWYNWVAPEELIQKDFQAMLDFYSLEPEPDPKWDPTIEDLRGMLQFMGADDVEYKAASRCFLLHSYVQTPWYDSGGSIDAIDVRIEESSISLKEAQKCWEDLINEFTI